jgi:uncharacterized protein YbcI
MADQASQERSDGARLNSAIARAVVRSHSDHVGRGPTKAYAFFHQNIVVVVLQDTMSRAERRLVARGGAATVRRLREAFHEGMHDELVEAVEQLTGRRVVALLNDAELEPDVSVELFVLDEPVTASLRAVRTPLRAG